MNRNNAYILPAVLGLALVCGCGSKDKKDRDFHTSGSREADQRAEQRVAKVQQLRGEGAKSEEKGGNVKKSLFERLGGDEGIKLIVEDFLARALADPRVNWERKGITQGGLSINRSKSVEWKPSGENIAKLKTHLAQFLSLATGGPAKYEGRDMQEVHAGMHITNAEFDATIGDLKATLDKLGVAIDEQKELMAIVESTRPQIAKRR